MPNERSLLRKNAARPSPASLNERFMGHLCLCLGALAMLGCSSPRERAISVYSGSYSDNALAEEILLAQPLSFENASIAAITLSQVIAQPSDAYRWEIEGGLATWFGLQDHQELNGLVLFRWLQFPWNQTIRTSMAIGNGISLASRKPKLEEAFHPDTGTSNLLYHIAVEIDFALPSAEHWSWFVRAHHRSGVFGLIDGVNGGSNVIAFGLRYRF